ncbi:glycosyl hydrolase family 5 [Solitalea longa]|uniref:Glycosyl hydrolase family 5 n=2 Tax=Solitalea longa TaxID=2079460 RepID=A0A2S5A0T4_9SPHI|nr:glycosyl hydrolase family 5 [Solitalea longa]
MIGFMLFFMPFAVAGQGFLKTQGKLIVNEKGKKVILRGMGLGGWMLQEGYMFKLGTIGQQYKIRDSIQALIGKVKTDEFYTKWLNDHTSKKDIDSLAAWGFNSVRLPMHYNLYTLPVEKEPVAGQNTWLETGFALTDSLLNWCKANHLYLILDLHAAPGGQGNDLAISDRDPAKPSIWESEANRLKTVALWKKLAQRYANEPYIGGYDIINEPNWGFTYPKDRIGNQEKENKPLRQLMMDITKAIREVDSKHIIIIEGNAFGNNYHGVMPLWDDNMAVSFHKYGNFNDQPSIQGFLDLQKANNMPLWMGESGENSNTWYTQLISMVEANDIGWAWWQLKKMGSNNPMEIKITPGYQQLVDYWTGKGEKPSAAEAQATLDELAENLKIENNVYHKDVIDAMFRQVQSIETIPFKKHLIKQNTIINAVDYDLGRQRYAYYDADSASYHYTPGVNTVGNKGRIYRNDGVDIQKEGEDHFVFKIEDGEWLQYTINVADGGKYSLNLLVSADSTAGKISVFVNDEPKAVTIEVPVKGEAGKWQEIKSAGISLKSGLNKLKIKFDKGGFYFKSFRFAKI